MKILGWLILALILVNGVLAQEGKIKLLALVQSGEQETGTIADLSVEIVPGTQRVFLETFPLTKISTQVSLRFAQQIACREFEHDCRSKDFFFTMDALPGIVGGPSAGSAAAVLVASVLEKIPIRSDIAITGTINSGGIIGPVGGLKKKIEAAGNNGISTILIPAGTSQYKDENNATLDLVEFGKKNGLNIVEVSTLGEAMAIMTGKEYHLSNETLVIEPKYLSLMEQIADETCERTVLLKEKVKNVSESVKNYTLLSEEVKKLNAQYSRASYCFRSNVLLKQEWFTQESLNPEEISSGALAIKKSGILLDKSVSNRSIDTITDMQATMAVKERLSDVDETLVKILSSLNDTEEASKLLAYAEERLFSAKTWSKFLDGNENSFSITAEQMKKACITKLGEAEERINYVRTLLPNALENSRDDLNDAYREFANSSFVDCIYRASKSKAEADVILSLIGIEKDELDSAINLKLSIVRDTISKLQKHGIFPITGYSYYEYADSLKSSDRASSILFLEYALEFTHLDMYFEQKPVKRILIDKNYVYLAFAFVIGLLIGIIIQKGFRTKKVQRRKKL